MVVTHCLQLNLCSALAKRMRKTHPLMASTREKQYLKSVVSAQPAKGLCCRGSPERTWEVCMRCVTTCACTELDVKILYVPYVPDQHNTPCRLPLDFSSHTHCMLIKE
jgi:hypothetical protein